ncbi:MAG: hypothetical protein FJX25_02930 [Alphaproteobacteria bacterium]|nr:hypothetical protein [Alphaproteobacteria bacterium]
MPSAWNSTGGRTGAIAAVLVVLALGLFGTVGWLAALVLGLVAGLLLGALLHWLLDGGVMAMDGSAWAPVPPEAAPVAMAAPIPQDAEPRVGLALAPRVDLSVQGGAEAEDLRQIRGIGPKVEAALHKAGVTRFAQIAEWDDALIDEMAVQTGRAASRIRGDDWVGQAKVLAGDAGLHNG